MKEKLIVQIVVGYMYKVMKSGKNITHFNDEFAAIRHGDYKEFLKLIGEPVDFLVVYNAGVISDDPAISDNDPDFVSLIRSAKSLETFYKRCVSVYGKFNDSEIPNSIFEYVALFELSLRMHRNNTKNSSHRIRLETIIDELKELKNLTQFEVDQLHDGRRFLNMIKRPNKMNSSWLDGIKKFESAYAVITKNRMTIV